jgi:hypothetical protein
MQRSDSYFIVSPEKHQFAPMAIGLGEGGEQNAPLAAGCLVWLLGAREK